MQIDYPLHISGRGRTASTDYDEHVRDLIEQLLFTSPGERVNRPTFGTGLMQLLFAPNSDELATATGFLIQSSLQQWLGDYVQIEAVETRSEDSTLFVTVRYLVRATQERRVEQFSRGV